MKRGDKQGKRFISNHFNSAKQAFTKHFPICWVYARNWKGWILETAIPHGKDESHQKNYLHEATHGTKGAKAMTEIQHCGTEKGRLTLLGQKWVVGVYQSPGKSFDRQTRALVLEKVNRDSMRLRMESLAKFWHKVYLGAGSSLHTVEKRQGREIQICRWTFQGQKNFKKACHWLGNSFK